MKAGPIPLNYRLLLVICSLIPAAILLTLLSRPVDAHGSGFSAEGLAQAETATPAFSDENVALKASIFLPYILRESGPGLIVEEIWLADGKGEPRSAFLSGGDIRYYIKGTNYTHAPVKASLRWRQTGPCGPTTVFTGTVTLEKGSWLAYVPAAAPNCTGVFTPTLQLNYSSQLTTLESRFVVNPASQVLVLGSADKTSPAFDRCNTPSVSEMKVWWEKSPYYSVNLYLGGSSLFPACSKELDAFWVHEVSRQGWGFIPAWVGPQAPCSSFDSRMSPDPAEAYREGQDEADSAARAAARLGLLGKNILYYDVELYPDDTACRNTVKSFVRGWVERLHELGAKAGVYGGACSSSVADWATLDPAPDDVWIAWWYGKSYQRDATVWGAPCISDSLWADDQRIVQYAGDHLESWGGVSLDIDSDAVDGEVGGIPWPAADALAAQAGAGQASQGAIFTRGGPQIRDMDLLSSNEGWILAGSRLLTTEDGGTQWQDMTPAGNSTLLSAFFLDDRRGWSALRGPGNGQVIVQRTIDGGKSWNPVPILVLEPELARAVETVRLYFTDTQTGWAALKLLSGSSFSLGKLMRTVDGGQTWQLLDLPSGEPVHFLDARHGWISAGPESNEGFITADGGLTWQAQPDSFFGLAASSQGTELTPASLPSGTVAYRFLDRRVGWAQVFQGECRGDKLRLGESLPAGAEPFQCTAETRLLKTLDGGQSWIEITPDLHREVH